MNNLDDTRLKVEIDEITININSIIKKIDEFNPAGKKEPTNDEDWILCLESYLVVKYTW